MTFLVHLVLDTDAALKDLPTFHPFVVPSASWSTLQNYMQMAGICLANTRVSFHSKRDLVCRYAQQEPELPGTSTVWEFLRFTKTSRNAQKQCACLLSRRATMGQRLECGV